MNDRTETTPHQPITIHQRLSAVMEDVGAENPELLDAAISTLMSRTREQIKTDFKKRAKNVPGYSEDWDRTIPAYLHHAARNIAGMKARRAKEIAWWGIVGKEKDGASAAIQGLAKDDPIRLYWENYRDYMGRATNDFAFIRKVGFFRFQSNERSLV